MLTENEQDLVKAKVAELEALIRGFGVVGTEIEIRANDNCGFTQYSALFDGGFWRSSTQTCNPDWGASNQYIRTAEPSYWKPSNLSC